MTTNRDEPRIPTDVCMYLAVQVLVAEEALSYRVGTTDRTLTFTDPARPGIEREEPIRVVNRGENAILTLSGQHFACESWPLKDGRRFWQVRCACGRACRKLWKPLGSERWACRHCWRIRPPSQRPRRAGRRAIAAGNWIDHSLARDMAYYHAAAAFYGGPPL